MRRRLGVTLILALTLSGVLFWRFFAQAPVSQPTASNDGLAMTAYARAVELMATDEQGQEAWRVSAPTARYFKASDLWQLDTPRWRIQTEDGTPWLGDADQARSWDQERKARLTGNVRLRQYHADGDTTLTTEWIEMQLPTRYAETSAPIQLAAPAYQIDAVGARLWLAEERIELNHDVRGRYEQER